MDGVAVGKCVGFEDAGESVGRRDGCRVGTELTGARVGLRVGSVGDTVGLHVTPLAVIAFIAVCAQFDSWHASTEGVTSTPTATKTKHSLLVVITRYNAPIPRVGAGRHAAMLSTRR